MRGRARSIHYVPPKWRIELLAGRFPREQWVPLVRANTKPYTFVEREAAVAEMEKLKAVQPHAEYRIAPIA